MNLKVTLLGDNQNLLTIFKKALEEQNFNVCLCDQLGDIVSFAPDIVIFDYEEVEKGIEFFKNLKEVLDSSLSIFRILSIKNKEEVSQVSMAGVPLDVIVDRHLVDNLFAPFLENYFLLKRAFEEK